MRLVFMGTPDFARHVLQALLDDGHDVVCVYSQPPRAAGRGMALKASPIQELAERKGIEVRTPASLKAPDEQAKFSALKTDAAVVVAYGLLLPKAILDAPKYGCFNVHASLLPRWRGAAPIQRAIMSGDEETGVTIMRMEEGLDTGPMVRSASIAIDAETTAASLHDKLAILGARLMVEALRAPAAAGTPQPENGVTYARKIDKAETKIDFSKPAVEVRNHIHGLSPMPGAWFSHNGRRIKVLKSRAATGKGDAGLAIDDNLTIACGLGAIQFLELQREGKGAMTAEAFLRGYPIHAGTRLA